MLAQLAPDAILMDLAMPGIDGWATVRAIRAAALSSAPIAIVSGNAFDKGLENDAGISGDDFILKPVRVPELLDWLGRAPAARMDRGRTRRIGERAGAATPERLRPARCRAAARARRTGEPRATTAASCASSTRSRRRMPAHAPFVTQLRGLARQFQLDAMTRVIRQALAEVPSKR